MRELGGVERMDTLLRYRRLRWLGHVARMGHWRIPRDLLVCKPDGGRRAAGGQKLRWNDVVLKDLKVCGIQDNWFELAQDRDSWRRNIKAIMVELNSEAEDLEVCKKDEKKRRRENRIGEAEAMFKCSESGCGFVAQSRAGLVNHRRQKHSAYALTPVPCQFCRRTFRPQGLRNHEKFCSSCPKT